MSKEEVISSLEIKEILISQLGPIGFRQLMEFASSERSLNEGNPSLKA